MTAAGAKESAMSSWRSLVQSVEKHQELLQQNNIGVEVKERDRIRVNARRVGLEAPPFADEAEQTLDRHTSTNDSKKDHERQNEHEQNVHRVFSQ